MMFFPLNRKWSVLGPKVKQARWWADHTGSASLEGALVFPVIFILTFLVLFFAIYIAQNAIVYYRTAIAGERTAFNWSNSAKDPLTGAYPEGSYDGLYWRVLDDGVLAGWLGNDDGKGVAVEFPSASGSGDGLAASKLQAGAGPLASDLSGKMSYLNRTLERTVSTVAFNTAVPEPLRRFNGTSFLGASTDAVVVEPAEFIRSFDTVRYYAKKMKGAAEGEDSYLQKIKSVWSSRSSSAGKS
ncbi:TadE family protein [Cohnella zeiphila]|uniref:Pilus assembly protein n=1 Tax=Cohnella zeiphila TaxID=2761120 RepID=A0A7X0SJ72_9BACL|nr:TadE family protein [Cohnella zeiphila]MBB6730970.1 pilus assembly protein [Cohnella zeiphila]